MRARTLLVLLVLLLPVYPGSATHAATTDPAARPWVVIAVVDSGINPYHADFAASTYPDAVDLSLHPSTYLAGYPSSATRLDLTLGAPDYASAVAADAARFAAIPKGGLQWIPGTKIIGAIDLGDQGFAGVADPTPILDDFHHGTAVASLAAGNQQGTCPRCLLVVVEDTEGVGWALDQPWIDVVVNSWGEAANVGVPNPEPRLGAFDLHFATRDAAECGQTVVFASGNGLETFTVPEQTYLSNSLGPGWVLRIGGYLVDSTGERVPMWGTGKPVSALARGVGAIAAVHMSRSQTATFTGTSASAPIAAAAFAETLRLSRAALHDVTEGYTCSGQILASGAAPAGAAAGSPLADGVLTRSELWDSVLRSAQPTAFTGVSVFPLGVNAAAMAAVNEGYGTLDGSSAQSAYSSLLTTIPARPDVQEFMNNDELVREALWGPWDQDGDGESDATSVATAVFWSLPLA